MVKVLILLSAAIVGLVAAEGQCLAQTLIGPPKLQANKGPTTSPYLFLAQPEGNEAINYYRRVRPELQFRATAQAQSNSIQQLQRDVQRIDETIFDPTNTIGQTGHQATFFYYGGYFNSNPANFGARNFGPGGP